MFTTGISSATQEVLESLNQSTFVSKYYLAGGTAVFGSGIKLFEETKLEEDFEFVSSKELPEGLVQLNYKRK